MYQFICFVFRMMISYWFPETKGLYIYDQDVYVNIIDNNNHLIVENLIAG